MRGSLLSFILLLLIGGCRQNESADRPAPPTPQPSAAPAAAPAARAMPGAPMIRTELYFGMHRRSGGSVTEREWRAFLDTAITPRFPDGLTVLEGNGQYRGRTGVIERERTKLVIILHDGAPTRFDLFKSVIAAYTAAFDQESVLRVNDSVRAEF